MRSGSNLILLFLLMACFSVKAQTDTTRSNAIPRAEHKPMSSVQKATLLSLIPGAGQFYNGRYWKIPVIYAGFAALTYSYIFYEQVYQESRTAYKQKIQGQAVTNPEYANVPEEMLYSVRESYRKSRDLSAIGLVGLYAFNLMDAAVDAHLKAFDVGDNLSLKIAPALIPDPKGMTALIRVGLRF